jgi:hypothetical protein
VALKAAIAAKAGVGAAIKSSLIAVGAAAGPVGWVIAIGTAVVVLGKLS